SIIQPDNWGYKPVHIFAQEGEHWTKSLDNLLVWLSWLGDGRFERARDIVNQRVFRGTQKFLKGIRKSPPQAIVLNGKETHSLDKLSSGEKSLVQLFLRIGTHITRNSILLIDEMDVHLHPKWQHRLLNILKGLLKDHPGLTVIATTHSREILRAFAYEIKEEGLRKGGYIIEKDLD
ncbi:MAG: AAA family ATPase, partial [Desulfobacteraceae bacterium IS3]